MTISASASTAAPLGRLAGLYRRFLAWRERRRAHRALYALDDRLLADIGLRRAEIGSVLAEMQGRAEATRLRPGLDAAPPRAANSDNAPARAQAA